MKRREAAGQVGRQEPGLELVCLVYEVPVAVFTTGGIIERFAFLGCLKNNLNNVSNRLNQANLRWQ